MSAAVRPTPLRRDRQRGLVGGVLAGLGARMGIDPVILRVAFVIAAVASGGLALLVYLVAWAAIPAAEGGAAPLARLARAPRVPGDWRVAVGVGLLTLSALLAFRELGIWWSDPLVWPLVLAAFGAALLWRRSRGGADGAALPGWTEREHPAPTTAEPALEVPARTTRPPSRFSDLYSGVFGVLLVI